MAKVKPADFLESISGRVSRRDRSCGNVYYDRKVGNVLARVRFKTSGFTTNQITRQTRFASAAAAKVTLMANSTQVNQYRNAFAAQSKYKTLAGYIMAACIANADSAANQQDNQGSNQPE